MTDFTEHKRRLNELAQDLEARQHRLQQHGRDGVPADFEDQASARENDEVVESLEHQVNEELALVRAALQRMDLGTYGKCTRCGEAIASARLNAVPYASACSACA